MKVLEIKVKPRSRVDALEELPDGTWLARVKPAPVDGKANKALVALIAAAFGVPKRHVLVKTGASGRHKLVHITEPG